MGAIENRERRLGHEKYGREVDVSHELRGELDELRKLVDEMNSKKKVVNPQINIFND